MATDTTTQEQVDYVQAKKYFMDWVDYWLNKQRLRFKKRFYDVHSQKNIEDTIQQILDSVKLSKRYEVVQRGAKYILVLKRKHESHPYIQVLSWEEMFDLFMPMHVQSGHKGRDVLMSIAGVQYKYPSMVLTFFRRICNVCNRTTGKTHTLLVASNVGLVYVISMVQMRSDEQFRYLLIYADKETNFVVLRPLTAKTDLEIAMELFKIFTSFGPPKKLHLHGYNSNLTKLVDQNLKEICPEFRVEIEHNPVSYDMPTIVIDRIQEWMRDNNSDIWEIGTCIVQRLMNNDPKMKPNNCYQYIHSEQFPTPHSLFFRLPSSKITPPTQQSKEKLKQSCHNMTEEGQIFEEKKKTVDKDPVATQIAKPDDSNVIILDDESD